MIVESEKINMNGVDMSHMSHPDSHWACGYVEGTTEIVLLFNDPNSPIQANTNSYSLLVGFSSNILEEFEQEIINRGLTKPTQ